MPEIDTFSDFKFKQDPCIAKILPPPPNPRRRRRKFSNNGNECLLMTPLPQGLPTPLIPYVESGSTSSSDKEPGLDLPSARKAKNDELSMEDRTRDLLSEYKPVSKKLDPPLQPKILISSLMMPQYDDSVWPVHPAINKSSSCVRRGAAPPPSLCASTCLTNPPPLFNSNSAPRWGRAIPRDQLMMPHKRITSADPSSKPRSISALRASWNLVRRPVTATTESPLGMRTVTIPMTTDISFPKRKPSNQQPQEAGGLRRLPISRETYSSKTYSSKSTRSTTSDSKNSQTTKKKKKEVGSKRSHDKGSDILTFKKMCDFVNNLLLVEARVQKTDWRYRYFCDWIEMGREYRLAVERLRILKKLHSSKAVDDILRQSSLNSLSTVSR